MVTHLPWARRILEQVRLGKREPVFSSDDISAGTRQLCSSEAGSSLLWEVLLDTRAFTEVYKCLVRAWLAFGSRRKGLWFPKKGRKFSLHNSQRSLRLLAMSYPSFFWDRLWHMREFCPISWKACRNFWFNVKPCSKTIQGKELSWSTPQPCI